MKFSIIIINYNTLEYTQNCLDSIFANLPVEMFELILVDNNSPDGSGQILKEKYCDRVKTILNNQNLGFGAANNQGAKIAQGEYLWFLNSDTLIDNVNLEEIDKIFKNNQKLGVTSVDLLMENRKRQSYAFGEFLSLKNLLKRGNNIGKECSGYYKVDWLTGASMIVRREIFNKVSGFDEKFFMYFEDMDLCKRIKESGFEIWFLKSYSIIHFGGKSAVNFEKMKSDYYISQDYFFLKHYGKFQKFFVRLLRSIYLFIKNK